MAAALTRARTRLELGCKGQWRRSTRSSSAGSARRTHGRRYSRYRRGGGPCGGRRSWEGGGSGERGACSFTSAPGSPLRTRICFSARCCASGCGGDGTKWWTTRSASATCRGRCSSVGSATKSCQSRRSTFSFKTTSTSPTRPVRTLSGWGSAGKSSSCYSWRGGRSCCSGTSVALLRWCRYRRPCVLARSSGHTGAPSSRASSSICGTACWLTSGRTRLRSRRPSSASQHCLSGTCGCASTRSGSCSNRRWSGAGAASSCETNFTAGHATPSTCTR
mmetsp:Transcript_26150/g.61329  ORF Transcript_26150/g.61329 Transcript_26150/m.61329 type:complete len:277 (+) Transcript_26150:218-1048(+)